MAMLSEEEVLKIARLSRLHLTKEEVVLYQKRLSRVLDYMKELESLSLSQEKDFAAKHITQDAQIFRKDVAQTFPDCQKLLENAADRADGYFRLPQVME